LVVVVVVVVVVVLVVGASVERLTSIVRRGMGGWAASIHSFALAFAVTSPRVPEWIAVVSFSNSQISGDQEKMEDRL